MHFKPPFGIYYLFKNAASFLVGYLLISNYIQYWLTASDEFEKII